MHLILALSFSLILAPSASAAGNGVVEVSMQIDSQGHGVVQASADVAAPPETVYRTLLDCDRAARIIPGLRSCKVVSSDPEGEIREHVIRISFFLPLVHSTSRVMLDPNRQIRFTCIRGDIRVCDGRWRLTALDGGQRTRVTYDFRASAPFGLPISLVGRTMRRDAPAALRALQRECEGS